MKKSAKKNKVEIFDKQNRPLPLWRNFLKSGAAEKGGIRLPSMLKTYGAQLNVRELHARNIVAARVYLEFEHPEDAVRFVLEWS